MGGRAAEKVLYNKIITNLNENYNYNTACRAPESVRQDHLASVDKLPPQHVRRILRFVLVTFDTYAEMVWAPGGPL